MATTPQGSSPFPTADNGMRTTPSGMSSLESDYGTADTVGRVKQSVHDAVDRIADKAGPAMERVRSSVSGLSDTVHQRGEQMSEMQEQWLESCRSTVREHPLATVAVAVAAGVLLSKIMSSSR